MPQRSAKRPKVVRIGERDTNQLARSVINRTIELSEEDSGKDPAAVSLGRRGGLKGGPARMASLTAEQRRKLGLKGAKARWGKKR